MGHHPFLRAFLFLLQRGCHGNFSFKPNTTHLNWCKGGEKEKQSPFMHNSKQPPTQKTAQAWSLHLKGFALYTLPSPRPNSMAIAVFCFDLFIPAFILAFQAILYYTKLLEGHAEFPR